MEKIISFKYGISINGELQRRTVTKYMEGDECKHEIVDKPISPKDPQKMGDWDVKSQQIIEALYVQNVFEEWDQERAYFWEEFAKPGFREIVNQDRNMDDLWRISIRKRTQLVENGKVISMKYHRSWIMPGSPYSSNDIISRRVAEVFHTQPVIDNYIAAMAVTDAFEDGLNGEKIIK